MPRFSLSTGGEVPVFITLLQDEPLNSGHEILAPNKLERSLYRMVLIYLEMIISVRHNVRV